MDKTVVKGLNDKIYEKRKAAAQQLEKIVRDCIANENYELIDRIIEELYRDYAYAMHQPMARNAGLMGLAAAAIALGNKYVATYLNKILPPVLACFGDQNDEVRFYACESLYNIAKIAKGDILVYFNEVFDVLCKISADTDVSVKGAAELLDRLIKDIVSECASTHIAAVNSYPKETPAATTTDPQTGDVIQLDQNIYDQEVSELAFSLPAFIPLLSERIHAINSDTRMFMVSWLQVLESIPGLELVSYLPTFLPGLFNFLTDPQSDVKVVTLALLKSLLLEVEHVSQLQNSLNSKEVQHHYCSDETPSKKPDGVLITERKKSLMNKLEQLSVTENLLDTAKEYDENYSPNNIPASRTSSTERIRTQRSRNGEIYHPGQDVNLDFPRIIEILVNNLGSSEPEIQSVAMNWMQTIIRISPNYILPYLSKILAVLLKILSHVDVRIGEMASQVNAMLIDLTTKFDTTEKINYDSIVNTLTLPFLDSDVTTKIACLDWLILIYHKDPQQLVAHDDSTHLTLLKSLSDKDPRLITKALELLCNLCNDSNEEYVRKFVTNLLKLFKDNDKLLKTRANSIIRQLSAKLSAERIYRTISPIIEDDADIHFNRMIIHSLTTNLITTPELRPLRNKLRSGQDWPLFVTLFKSWSRNPVSLLSMCLVSEMYELAYSVLKLYVDYDLTANDLLQIDLLVQFLESPVFTRLRMQLLEQEKYPYLHKCLYGLLMVLPQSKAFEILNARLNSVSRLPTQPKADGGKLDETLAVSSQRDYRSLLEHFKKVCDNERNSASLCLEENGIDLCDILGSGSKINGNSANRSSARTRGNVDMEISDNDTVILSGL
ncbi:HCL236Wp [Eremothecium sinecaudum]|uniref:HCL236Wp n=1 Tax=Eremothecium sinecaudum TaxID=45286 RepID=A0A0X8HR50_9SACH|nr:HCL236Wp [Eremothecium sinecaudum]AMD19915.1 HCL236Wp [Eremothecium sinecaudum]